MLIRTVRMTFRPEDVADFLDLFEQTSPRIRGFAGCRHLELWQDPRYENIFATYSLWTGPDALEAYRQSALFRETWAATRRWFAAPAVAHSYQKKTGDG